MLYFITNKNPSIFFELKILLLLLLFVWIKKNCSQSHCAQAVCWSLREQKCSSILTSTLILLKTKFKISYNVDFFYFQIFILKKKKISILKIKIAEEDHDFDLCDDTCTLCLRLCSHLDSWIVKRHKQICAIKSYSLIFNTYT